MVKTIGRIAVILLILLDVSHFSHFALAESDVWNILQPAWWNAPKASIIAVRNQLQNHIRLSRGEEIVSLPEDESVTGEEWLILKPGWWNASPEEIQQVETQLTNHIDVLEGRLAVASQAAITEQSVSVTHDSMHISAYSPEQITPLVSQNDSNARTAVRITSSQEVNIRSQPSSDSTIYARAKPGDVLELISSDYHGWYKIRLSDGVTVGYVSAKLSSLTQIIPESEINIGSNPVMSVVTPISSPEQSSSIAVSTPVPAEDPMAYSEIRFDLAFQNNSYLGKKTVITGIIEDLIVSDGGKTFIIVNSPFQNWEIHCQPDQGQDITSGDTVTVLGVIKDNFRLDESTGIETVMIEADYIEIK